MTALTFTGLGGCREIGRSCFLVRAKESAVLLDCGLGSNDSLPLLEGTVNPAEIDAVILTHAHLDHTGFLPIFCDMGFDGVVLASTHTLALTWLLWETQRPAAFDAQRWRRGMTRARHQWRALEAGNTHRVGDLSVRFRHAGHILGSVMVEISDASRRMLYTGDIDFDSALERPCDLVVGEQFDAVICESTYGGITRRPKCEVMGELIGQVDRCIARGGNVLIPAIGTGITQEILIALATRHDSVKVPLIVEGRIQQANAILSDAYGDGNSLGTLMREGLLSYPQSRQARQNLLQGVRQAIVVAPPADTQDLAGWYLERLAGSEQNLLAVVGYLPPGSAVERVMRQSRAANIEISRFEFSNHADGPTLERTLAQISAKSLYCVHGDESRARALCEAASQLTYKTVEVPDVLDTHVLL